MFIHSMGSSLVWAFIFWSCLWVQRVTLSIVLAHLVTARFALVDESDIIMLAQNVMYLRKYI